MRCWYCYRPLSLLPGEEIEIATKDHLVPVSRGGTDRIDNIAPACFRCNRAKAAMTEAEFRAAFHTAFTALCSDVPNSSGKTNFSLIDQPSLGKLRQESEGLSWAWRHPA